ncbi:60S ribosomal protein L34A [Brettanomyces bruxellensis]|uniref:60S ribosomal protein L34A n=1 Tax=Dekkera bruxellensis TaxID=5007 RepID=A0A8H6BPX6_DEKBR|nr:60S ribosomal protein L34A [Brettanomyces bruxellensis]KAF6015785.1 60S ribosomal protein L34A [Brettanomyces bruxellensis]
MQLENHRAAILQVSSVGVHSVQKDVYNKQTKDQVGLKEDATIIYNTKSNQIKVVKTPGGKLVAHHIKKLASRPKCGDCGVPLPGIAVLRPRQYASISKTHKTVSRAYGGSRCANCVKDRIIRAFLIEEQKIVKKVIKEHEEKEKKQN